MTIAEAEKILRNNWWKRHNKDDHNGFEVNIKEVLDERQNSIVFLAAIERKGTPPNKWLYNQWQVDADGDCGVLIKN